MTATWMDLGSEERGRPGLQLAGDGVRSSPDTDDRGSPSGRTALLTVVPGGRPSAAGPRSVPPEVRRRRAVLVVMGLLSIALALPLSGTGGHSHAPGSASAETRGPAVYTVQPGDSLWSIAQRVDPSGDPRPLTARLATQTGSDTVVPGERIVLP